MKKKILLIIITIGAGILFTFYFLNKENIYAKEEYIVYAFQVGAFKNYENAQEYSQNFESFIIKQEDNFSKYLSFGLTFSLAFQTILNLMVVVGLIPVTGVTLPFLSYGGSSLLVSMTNIGILLNISKHNK